MIKSKRNGIKNLWWNPEMVDGAFYVDGKMPYCPTTAMELPKDIITWEEAKCIYNKNVCKLNNLDFYIDVYVCFYIDDYKFDSTRGIWFCFEDAFKVLNHFKGIITPDFSTYVDFPEPLKLWNTYRMRAFGYQCGIRGLGVINNVRGLIEEDFKYCFKGIPKNSIVSIGAVASDLRKTINMPQFEVWLDLMVRELNPKIIIIYGSANYPCFKKLEDKGIIIKQYDSSTAKYFKSKKEVNKNDQK